MKKIHLILIFSACTSSIYSSQFADPKSRGKAKHSQIKAATKAAAGKTKYKDKAAPNSPNADNKNSRADKTKK